MGRIKEESDSPESGLSQFDGHRGDKSPETSFDDVENRIS